MEVRMGGGGRWVAGGWRFHLFGLFRIAMYETKKYVPATGQDNHEKPKRHLTNTGTTFRPILPIYLLPWGHCPNHDFTWPSKLSVEKQMGGA